MCCSLFYVFFRFSRLVLLRRTLIGPRSATAVTFWENNYLEIENYTIRIFNTNLCSRVWSILLVIPLKLFRCWWIKLAMWAVLLFEKMPWKPQKWWLTMRRPVEPVPPSLQLVQSKVGQIRQMDLVSFCLNCNVACVSPLEYRPPTKIRPHFAKRLKIA